MVWGAIAWGKKSELVFMEKGRKTAADFVHQVYEGALGRFLEEFDAPILMEDGAPVHRAKIANEWRVSHGITKMDWPAQSPDMNPIENLWKILKEMVHQQFKTGMTLDTYRKVILASWQSIEIETINKLIGTMPERIITLKKSKGKSIRF